MFITTFFIKPLQLSTVYLVLLAFSAKDNETCKLKVFDFSIDTFLFFVQVMPLLNYLYKSSFLLAEQLN